MRYGYACLTTDRKGFKDLDLDSIRIELDISFVGYLELLLLLVTIHFH